MSETCVPTQELNSFKKFSDSLLSKSAKMHNLLSELEEYLPNMSDGADKKKANRPLSRQMNRSPSCPVPFGCETVWLFMCVCVSICHMHSV